MLTDLQNLPSRGIFPAAGSVMVCSRAPNYVAAHSTEPAQIVHQDPTNPLVRTLKLKKNAGKNANRKRKGSPASSSKKSGKLTGSSSVRDPAKSSPAGASPANTQLRNCSRLELGLMSLKGLQDVLRARGAPVSGRKAELVQRIEGLQKEAAAQEAAGNSTGANGGDNAAVGSQEDPVLLSDDAAEEI